MATTRIQKWPLPSQALLTVSFIVNLLYSFIMCEHRAISISHSYLKQSNRYLNASSPPLHFYSLVCRKQKLTNLSNAESEISVWVRSKYSKLGQSSKICLTWKRKNNQQSLAKKTTVPESTHAVKFFWIETCFHNQYALNSDKSVTNYRLQSHNY